MINKFKTFIWFLRQPKGLTLIANLVKRKTIYRKHEKTRKEAADWCKMKAVDTITGLNILFPDHDAKYVLPENLFPAEFEYARSKFKNTPYKMGGPGNMVMLYNICEYTRAKYVAETGVAYGWSSLSILLSLSRRDGSLLVSTDMPYAKMGNKQYVGIVVPEQLKKNWILIQESDISGLPKAFKKVPYLDVVHYDSDKSYVGRMISYPVLYNKLREGGIFISDDIQDNLYFKQYCDKLGVDPVIISCESKYVGVFIK